MQTTNNKTIEINSNESLVVETQSSAEKNGSSIEVETNISANATGVGTVDMNGTGNVEAIVDNKMHEETGIINMVLNFLKSFSFLGWFR